MESQSTARPRFALICAIVAVLFGLMTIISGGAILFAGGAMLEFAGDYVPFVLWFNFIAGFAYVVAGVGLYLWRGWAINLSLLIAFSTLIAFAGFGIHILNGGVYEPRTLGAMVLRSGVWITIGWLTYKARKKTIHKMTPDIIRK